MGIIGGPAVTLIVVDYFIFRARKLQTIGLFDFKLPAYRYTLGFNLAAFVAFGAGFACFLLVYDPVAYAPRATGAFNVLTATGTACIVSAVVYVVLTAIPGVRGYVLRDRRPETGAPSAKGVGVDERLGSSGRLV